MSTDNKQADGNENSGNSKQNQQKQSPPAQPKPQKPTKKSTWLSDVFDKPLRSLQIVLPSQQEIVRDFLFVLDANVLINIYDLSEQSFREVAKLLRKLANEGRLFVTANGLREYICNRGTVLEDAQSNLLQKIILLEKCPVDSLNNISLMQDEGIDKDLPGAITTYGEAKKSLLRLLKQQANRVSNWQWNDRVTKLYRELFIEDRIIPDDITKNIESEMQSRYAIGRPPGFADAGKLDGGSGDLITWFSLLEYGKLQKRNIAFVTSDHKEDWWINTKVEGKVQPIVARHELIHEFASYTSQQFALLHFSQFLESHASTKESVAEAKLAEEPSSFVSDRRYASFREIVNKIRTAIVMIEMMLQFDNQPESETYSQLLKLVDILETITIDILKLPKNSIDDITRDTLSREIHGIKHFIGRELHRGSIGDKRTSKLLLGKLNRASLSLKSLLTTFTGLS